MKRAASRSGDGFRSAIGNTAMPQPMSDPTRNGYSAEERIAAPMGAPLPGCRSGMPATCAMPPSAATWRHWSTESDSIQLFSDVNRETVGGNGKSP